MSTSLLIPAAQYLRMSTDDQQTSIPVSAPETHQEEREPEEETAQVIEKIWLPPRDSNPDMLIQSPFPDSENKQNPATHSADSGKHLQNPHHPRTNLGPKRKGEL